jgi:hypothetical protein
VELLKKYDETRKKWIGKMIHSPSRFNWSRFCTSHSIKVFHLIRYPRHHAQVSVEAPQDNVLLSISIHPSSELSVTLSGSRYIFIFRNLFLYQLKLTAWDSGLPCEDLGGTFVVFLPLAIDRF